MSLILLSLSAFASGPTAHEQTPINLPVLKVKRKLIYGDVPTADLYPDIERDTITLTCDCTTSRADDGSYTLELAAGERALLTMHDATSATGDVWTVFASHETADGPTEWSRELDGVSMTFEGGAATEWDVALTFVSPAGESLQYGPIIKIKPKGG